MPDPTEPVPPTPPATPSTPVPPSASAPPAPEAPSAPPSPPRKDRLVQTRVPRELETRLKQEASRRRVTLSYLIRSLLEDTVSLVDGVLDSVDGIVSNSVELAENVGRDALRIARTAAGEGRLLGEDRRERRDRNTGRDARDDARGQPDPVPAHLAHVMFIDPPAIEFFSLHSILGKSFSIH